ncbi:unnamed protein product [marine sediment metagenome]|uniref:Uncharacterized protein n=1 Tax=marine sediment metagenome TaxID=412755 RepID=X1F2C9_9ZZZZ
MPQPGQKGMTFHADFVDGIEKFRNEHSEFGFVSNPEAMRYAWNFFVFEHEREKGDKILTKLKRF